MTAEPDFNTCLILAIEMLKRGAPSVDMHPWGLRLRAPTETLQTWSVGLIPQNAQNEYAASLLNEPPSVPSDPPTDGDEGDPNVTVPAPRVGVAS